MVTIIKCYCNIRKTNRFTVLCSCKYDIFHFRPTKLLRTLFTKNPSYSIGDITFPRAIRTYNACNSVMKVKYYLIGK